MADWSGPRRALVIGDLMLDVLTEGEASRLSPEAPVPVVLQQRRAYAAGGAGNAAVNLAMLGDQVRVIGAVGDDLEGELLRSILNGHGIDTRFLITTSGATTQKHRVVANGQQLVRVDVEDPALVSADVIHAVVEQMGEVDVVLISDYAKGVCTAELCHEVIRRAGVPVVVDSKGANYGRYRGATVITPNRDELGRATKADRIGEQARELVEELDCAVLVTRSAQGISLFERNRPELHLPAQARTVCDVTGAGDTVASVVAALLARGLDLTLAGRVANACAGLVVGRRGASPITREELLTIWAGLSEATAGEPA